MAHEPPAILLLHGKCQPESQWDCVDARRMSWDRFCDKNANRKICRRPRSSCVFSFSGGTFPGRFWVLWRMELGCWGMSNSSHCCMCWGKCLRRWINFPKTSGTQERKSGKNPAETADFVCFYTTCCFFSHPCAWREKTGIHVNRNR